MLGLTGAQLREATGSQAQLQVGPTRTYAVARLDGLHLTCADLSVSAQAALESCSAEVESELQRRCQLVAVAAQYDSQDCRGLPAHLHTLRLAADQGTQRQCLAQALRLSQQVAEQLDDANCLLLELLLRHKVEGQTVRHAQTTPARGRSLQRPLPAAPAAFARVQLRWALSLRWRPQDADGARAELLAARCAAMKEELAASTQQLLGQTYTDASVPALQAISDHVQGAVSELEARVQQVGGSAAPWQERPCEGALRHRSHRK